MSIVLFDRCDRLGANITTYISQIIYAHYHNIPVLFSKNVNEYRFYNNKVVKSLFDYLQYSYNTNFEKKEYSIHNIGINHDFISVLSNVVISINSDLISYFKNNLLHQLCEIEIPVLPFDPCNTILVHLRLDDVAHVPDYDGSICSNYYRNKIDNNEKCCLEFYGTINMQSPLSCSKLEEQINKALEKHKGYSVVFLAAKGSDVSPYNPHNYKVLQSGDDYLDIMYLTQSDVVILSRSTFSLSSLFFSSKKRNIYIPSWGHSVSFGLNTKYDKTNFNYFY